MAQLLRSVVEMSDWHRKRDGRGLGIGIMEKDDTLAAGVAEVSVDSGPARSRSTISGQ